MSASPTPEHLEELMAGYVLGNLCSEEAEEFSKLLTENPEIIQEVNRLQEVLGLLPYALPQVSPPHHLRSAIVEAVNTPGKTNPIRKLPTPAWSKVVGSVAAVFALALGINNYSLRQELKNNNDVITVMRQPETHLFSIKGKGNIATASGTVLMDFAADKAVIALQNTPTPSAGQAYWLWAVVGDKTIRCGQFDISSNGKVLDEFLIPDDSYDANTEISQLLVTLESSQDPQQPSRAIVMVSAS